MTFQIFNPPELGAPKGWNNGVLAPAGGRILFVAGQAGWEESAQGRAPDFAEQFARALDKVLAVVRAAGGAPTDIARLTIYATEPRRLHQRAEAARRGVARAIRKRITRRWRWSR